MARLPIDRNMPIMSNEMENLIKTENVPSEKTPPVMPITEDMVENPKGDNPLMSDMPMMDEEEKRIFTELLERGIPEDMIIDIMASAKVGATIPATAVNPAEFGGLPKPSSPDGNPSMTNPQTGNPETMNQNDMAMYLQNKVADIRSRTGGSPQGGVNPAIPNNPKMGALPQPPNQRPTMARDPYGADTTSSPFGNSMNKPMNT